MKINSINREMLITLYQRYKDAKINNGYSEIVLHNEFITSKRINDPAVDELSVSDLNEIDEWFEKVIKFGGSINYSLSETEVKFRQEVKDTLESSNKSLINVIKDIDVDLVKSNSYSKYTSFISIIIIILQVILLGIFWNSLNQSKSKITELTTKINQLDMIVEEIRIRDKYQNIHIEKIEHLLGK